MTENSEQGMPQTPEEAARAAAAAANAAAQAAQTAATAAQSALSSTAAPTTALPNTTPTEDPAGQTAEAGQTAPADTVPQAEDSGAAAGGQRSSGKHKRVRLFERLGRLPSASGPGAMQDPSKPAKPVDPKTRLRRGITMGMVMPVFMMIVMPLLMTGMFTGSGEPRGMDVAVVGTSHSVKDMRSDLDKQAVDQFDVSRVDNVGDAKKQIRERDIRAAYNPKNGAMYYAGGNGPRVKQAVTKYFTQVAKDGDKKLKTHDVAGLSKHDKLGSSVLFVGLGTILGGFMTGLMLSIVPASSKMRVILGILIPVVVSTAQVILGWGLFGAFTDHAMLAWTMMLLLSVSAVAVTMGGMLVFGPLWMPIAMVATTLLGISTSGVTAPLDMMSSGFYEGVHPWLFSSQGISAIRDAVYFPDVNFTQSVLVMLSWLVGGIALAVIGTMRQKKQHLDAELNKIEEAETAMAVAASV